MQLHEEPRRGRAQRLLGASPVTPVTPGLFGTFCWKQRTKQVQDELEKQVASRDLFTKNFRINTDILPFRLRGQNSPFRRLCTSLSGLPAHCPPRRSSWRRETTSAAPGSCPRTSRRRNSLLFPSFSISIHFLEQPIEA